MLTAAKHGGGAIVTTAPPLSHPIPHRRCLWGPGRLLLSWMERATVLDSESSCPGSLALNMVRASQPSATFGFQWEVGYLYAGGCWMYDRVVLKSTLPGPCGVAFHGFPHLVSSGLVDSGFCLPFLSPLLHLLEGVSCWSSLQVRKRKFVGLVI